MSKAWMPLYVGDYLGNTGHLNPGQNGAYILLLMHYWQVGTLRANKEEIYCIARATDEQSRCNADRVLEQFFIEVGGFYIQPRADRELAKAVIAYERRSSAADSRWKKEREKKLADAMNASSHMQCMSNPSDSDSIDSKNKDGVTEKSFGLDAAVSFVLVETGLAGMKIRSVVHEVVSGEMSKVGVGPKEAAEAMIAAWHSYDKATIGFKQSPENFFARGTWRKPESEWGISGKGKRADGWLPPQNVDSEYVSEGTKRKREIEAGKAAAR